MLIGFTGTRQGMTEPQLQAFQLLLERLLVHDPELTPGTLPNQFHHGDCIGADAEAHTFLAVYHANEVAFHIHPPLDSRYRAFCDEKDRLERRKTALTIYPTKEYLVRDHDIVDATQYLVAAPKEMKEQLRSGTWATVRYARAKNRSIYTVLPDGQTELHTPYGEARPCPEPRA